MNIVHLTASTQYGGPERQMLGLGHALEGDCRLSYVSFLEGGRCQAFLNQARKDGFHAEALAHDTPWLVAALSDLTATLRRLRADVLLCNSYKADLLGLIAARRIGIPVVAISRGWTSENFKVRCYEALDRRILRGMDRVVAVSQGQADKVRRTGVPKERLLVIRNAVRTDRFSLPRPEPIARLRALFRTPRRRIVGAVGRLSPEKGFVHFVEAAARLASMDGSLGFVLFGDGPLRETLERQARALGLGNSLVFAGFRDDLDDLFPCFDLLAVPSYTEGLPNVIMEACASGVPVVATAVGGTPEILSYGVGGILIPPGDVKALTEAIATILHHPEASKALGERGRQRMYEEFTFAAQAEHYRHLFTELLAEKNPCAEVVHEVC